MTTKEDEAVDALTLAILDGSEEAWTGDHCPSVAGHFPNLPATHPPLGITLPAPARTPVGAIGERPLSHERASAQSKRCGLCGSDTHKAWRCPKNAKAAIVVPGGERNE